MCWLHSCLPTAPVLPAHPSHGAGFTAPQPIGTLGLSCRQDEALVPLAMASCLAKATRAEESPCDVTGDDTCRDFAQHPMRLN